MKERYTAPEIEIIEFEEEVFMDTSGNGDITKPEQGVGDNDVNMEDTGWE